MVRVVSIFTTILTLPMALAAAVLAHVLASRAVKAVLWSTSPLSTGEPQAFTYERDVYRTAETAMAQVVGLVLAAGVLVWLGGLRNSFWILLLGVMVWAAALALDLRRWERVAVSANNLWFQRGYGHTVHQVAFENIYDVAVEEEDTKGFTLRYGPNNRVCRLQVRMTDKHVIALPKTDANSGIEAVEEMANQMRQRLRHREDSQSMRLAEERATQAAIDVAAQTPAQDAEMRLALKRLRSGALAPDVPKAVKLPNGS
jgi:hypothetical protein